MVTSIASIKEKYSDLRLVASDGKEVECSRFVMMSHCGLLQDIAECTEDFDTRTSFTILYDSHALRIIVDILHSVLDPWTVSRVDLESAVRIADYLKCDKIIQTLIDALWASITLDLDRRVPLQTITTDGTVLAPLPRRPSHPEALESLFTNIKWLFKDNLHMNDVIDTLVKISPTWPLFQGHLRRIVQELVQINIRMAILICRRLITFFPASILMLELLDLLPHPVSVEDVVALLGTACSGVYYHPGEIGLVLDRALEVSPPPPSSSSKHGSNIRSVLHTIKVGLQLYDPIPASASPIHGSVLLYEHVPTASALLQIHTRLRRFRSIRIASWLSITLHPTTGGVNFRLHLRKIDTLSRVASSCQVRIITMCNKTKQIGECWWLYGGGAVVLNTTLTPHLAIYRCGDEDTIRQCIMSHDLSSLRFDVYYGQHSILSTRPVS
jgi:hypothetical protein